MAVHDELTRIKIDTQRHGWHCVDQAFQSFAGFGSRLGCQPGACPLAVHIAMATVSTIEVSTGPTTRCRYRTICSPKRAKVAARGGWNLRGSVVLVGPLVSASIEPYLPITIRFTPVFPASSVA